MEEYKKEFIRFLIENQALRFGEFKLKSGRMSPYFMNTGMFNSGDGIMKLGFYYASLMKEIWEKEKFEIVFGPAYKGIPLAVTSVISLKKDFNIDVSFSSERKEGKSHGEFGKEDKGKMILGRKLSDSDSIVMVDDVFTTGDTKYEAINLLNSIAEDLKFPALVISFDRQEVDLEGRNAIADFYEKTDIPVHAVVKLTEVIPFLKSEGLIDTENYNNVLKYIEKYGTEDAKEFLD